VGVVDFEVEVEALKRCKVTIPCPLANVLGEVFPLEAGVSIPLELGVFLVVDRAHQPTASKHPASAGPASAVGAIATEVAHAWIDPLMLLLMLEAEPIDGGWTLIAK